MSANSHCFVPGCKTGYRYATSNSEDKHLSLFKPPIDKLSLWASVIPRADRQLTRRDRVCELHFASHHIIRDFVVPLGKENFTLPRGRPKLHPDAVPAIFPNLPAYLNRSTKQPRRIIQKHAHSITTANVNQCDVSPADPGYNCEVTDPLNFKQLGESHHVILAQCPKNWTSGLGADCVCFGKMVVENSCLQCFACVSVSSDMNITVFCRNNKILR